MEVFLSIIVKSVFAGLVGFSAVSWAIIVFKHLQIFKATKESVTFLDFFWKTGRFNLIAPQTSNYSNSPLAVIFSEAYGEMQKLLLADNGKKGASGELTADLGGIENVSRAIRKAINSEITKLEKLTTFLATVGSTSPFIGLLGTVVGILTTFRHIGESGSASLAVVAPGISEALIATAVGLVAAIPAVMAYNYFNNKIKVLAHEMDNFGTELLNIVQRNTSINPVNPVAVEEPVKHAVGEN